MLPNLYGPVSILVTHESACTVMHPCNHYTPPAWKKNCSTKYSGKYSVMTMMMMIIH